MMTQALSLPFSEEEIDVTAYTASLISLCVSHGILTAQRLDALKRTFDAQFREAAEQLTRRASGSLSLEHAEKLYSSVLYRSDAYLLSLKSAQSAADALRTVPPAEILARGAAVITRRFAQARLLAQRVESTALHIGFPEYLHAAHEAFDEFSRGYSARFAAQDICTSIDYPLLCSPAYALKSSGVLFICEYLSALALENEFCRLFPEKEVLGLLNSYGRLYGCPYHRLLFNVCAVVLRNALAAVMLGKEPLTLRLTKAEVRRLKPLSRAEITSALEKLTPKPSLRRYLGAYIPEFAAELERAADNGAACFPVCDSIVKKQ